MKEVRIIKNKIDFKLEATKLEDKAIVYMYGDIADERPKDFWTGEEVTGDYIIPAEVRNLFDNIEENDIELHINSYGGSVFASISIFNYLKSLNKNITTINDGICASGASLIFMAGTKAIMPSNTMLMIHRASSYGWGNCKDLRELADTLEKLDNSTVLETYKTRYKGLDEDLMSLIDSETWISAKECYEFGFCDELLEISNTDKNKEPEKDEITNGIKIMTNFAKLKFN